MAENKVRFNLKNVHYAALIDAVTPTWGTPKKLPGAVNLDLAPSGDVEKFYADGLVYYQSENNTGYDGDLEVGRFPEEMLIEIWRYILDESGVLLEQTGVETQAFALLFQIDGDKNHEYYCLYNCSGTRPGISSGTNTQTKNIKTQSSKISAQPLENGLVQARTSKTTAKEVKENWFKSVYYNPNTSETEENPEDNTETGGE